MKKLLAICFLLFCGYQSIAQQSGSISQESNLHGVVYDATSKAPLADVTVRIKDQFSKLVAAALTDEKGAFKLAVKPLNGTIEFSFIGYQTFSKSIAFETEKSKVDLGKIQLKALPNSLDELVVTGRNISAISLKLDKKVYNPSKDLLAQTGSVIDVLKGVPSVSVSPSGGISLRGNGSVLVMINGRRSGLSQTEALEQIPAEQVERVEVISNPSSSYDVAGTAGIINIVLKKNNKSGLNGQLRLVAGIPNDSRISPTLNYKTDRVNIFSTFAIRKTDYVGLYTTNQSTTKDGITTQLNLRQDEDRHDDGKLLYAGADFIINKQNSITAAFLKNATKDHDKTNLNYVYSSSTKGIDSNLMRRGESWENRDYNQLEFNYTKTFTNPGKKYTVDMQYDFWNSDKDWHLETRKIIPDGETLPNIRTSSVGASKDFMLKSDLVLPADSNSTFEFGFKMETRSVSSDFKAEKEQDKLWQIFDNINNQLSYNEVIGSLYTQFNSKIGKFAYQLGLRPEITRIKLEDRIGTYNDHKNYFRLFPTLSMTYSFNTSSALQGSYSRRINRPSLYLLYPFMEITDFNSRFIGNPELNPSYANVFEIGFLQNWSMLTLNPSLYYQNTTGFIQTYTYRNEDGTFISMPLNIHSEQRKGIELSALYSPLKQLQINIELNAYEFKQSGQYQNYSFDYSGKTFTSRISAQVKLPSNLSFQLRYNFTGAQDNAQSHTDAIHGIDVGTGLNIFKNKASFLFDISNLFNLRQFNTVTKGVDYILAQRNIPNAARYRLTFVYRLNLKENQNVRQAQSGNRN